MREVVQFREKENQVKTLEKKQKTVYGETHNGSRSSRRAKGNEDSLPYRKETTWRQMREPRPHCESERRIYHH